MDDDFNFCSVDLEGLLSGVSVLSFFLIGEGTSGPVVFPTHIVNGDCNVCLTEYTCVAIEERVPIPSNVH